MIVLIIPQNVVVCEAKVAEAILTKGVKNQNEMYCSLKQQKDLDYNEKLKL